MPSLLSPHTLLPLSWVPLAQPGLVSASSTDRAGLVHYWSVLGSHHSHCTLHLLPISHQTRHQGRRGARICGDFAWPVQGGGAGPLAGDVLCCLSLSQQCVSQFVPHTQSAYRDTKYSRLHTNIFIRFSLCHKFLRLLETFYIWTKRMKTYPLFSCFKLLAMSCSGSPPLAMLVNTFLNIALHIAA